MYTIAQNAHTKN